MLTKYALTRSPQRGVFLMLMSVLLSLAMLGASAPAQSSTPTLLLPDFTEIVEKTEESVVNIRTTEAIRVRNRGSGGGNDPYDLFRWFFGPDFMPPGFGEPDRRNAPPVEEERTVPRGVGSGFIISDDGYILTNNHVVARSNGIFVTLASGKEYTAEIVGTDPRTDIALIKVDANERLQPMKIGESATLKKGQWVLAIGSPFGLESTVTSGIVSAINRDTGDYLPFIQTDVAVNPGNSGGPLINLAGEVVGVNSQIISRSGGFMGISLAIPIDEAMQVVEQLKEHGKVTRGRIGVQITPVSDDVSKALGIGDARGALVSSVEPGGPADKAGVLSGDVILNFNGTDIQHMTDLPRLVGATRPGTRADMEVWRKGKSIKIKVVVDEMPAAEGETPPESGPEPSAAPVDALGLRVAPLTQEQRRSAGIEGGVRVTEVEGPAAAAGLAEGDIILTINDVDITGPDQYAKVVSGLDKSRAAAVLVLRNNQSQWVALTPRN